ncbi:adenylate/guanylate cyclase domain-containing protein [Shimia sp. R9_1]|uniref:adenylate/guanylate cyclase domain-containing protein n=1 Tax=Shimia sp. R9_1 TaxID=2821111 RepID=UPI001ADAC69B|nr:adenylate/guanylate cyclase domain-containing protein [Shimia sp. R9_1]MBO9408547.1 adenylate/guanylate cyclase domain-containing protein [Shimia sp. R9_1]
MQKLIDHLTAHPRQLYLVAATAIMLLPVALWFDLNSLSHHNLHRQATGLNRLMDNIRSYYASNVEVFVRDAEGAQQATLLYRQEVSDPEQLDAGVPSAETAAIALSERFSEILPGVTFRYVFDDLGTEASASDLSPFERNALTTLRDPDNKRPHLVQEQGGLFGHRLTMATPLIHAEDCADCVAVGGTDTAASWPPEAVRGLQIVHVRQPLSLNLSSFKFLLTYMLVAGFLVVTFARHQLQLAGKFRDANKELTENNAFLADVSLKISKYLEPQVYRSIFEGEKDASISTERKKLTVFFSDIKDFTATTERMQPEELTALLNEYFSEMGLIAAKHGATIDKFIGDAIVAFVGDPSTQGVSEDARACVRMALEMQQRLDELEQIWRARGVEHPFRARMGLNTGYCNVGNFGSETRMDYTIIGAEANLAARLEGIAEPGGIVMSYETYAHARDLVDAEPLEPQHFKGISRAITPYRVLRHGTNRRAASATEQGDKLVVEMQGLDAASREKITAAVRAALDEV